MKLVDCPRIADLQTYLALCTRPDELPVVMWSSGVISGPGGAGIDLPRSEPRALMGQTFPSTQLSKPRWLVAETFCTSDNHIR